MRLVRLVPLAVPVVVLAFAAAISCSSTDARPDAGDIDRHDGGGRPPTYPDTGVDTGKPPDASADGGDGGDACSNAYKDGLETDVDCGGTACAQCVDGKACVKDSDCAGNACVGKVCKTATCTDGVKNGDESDIDCGGTVCPKCTIGKACGKGDDCTSKSCGGGQCACPANMAIVSRTTGSSYCVDQAEVTKGQYYRFISATVPTSTQPAFCSANTTFTPRGAWPPATVPESQAYHFSIPVHYVDWCDAYAYCAWAGKQLCGQINGGAAPADQYADAGASAWYNACSAQGQKAWPYGTSYASGYCNVAGSDGGEGSAAGGWGYGGVAQDENTWTVATSDSFGNVTGYAHQSCQGGSVNLFQMSGNVAEWEDSCATTTGASDPCRLRGGSYAAGADSGAVRCDADRKLERVPAVADPDPLKDVGFRCCVY